MGNILKGMVSSPLKRFIAVAMAGSLVITGGMFAYAYTAASASITATTGSSDFASISGNSSVSDYKVFGSYRGTIGTGDLFELTATDYPGDVQVNVYLTNPDELGKNYGLWMLRLKLVNFSGGYMDRDAMDKVLSLNNGVVSFISDNLSDNTTYYIRSAGGFYRSFPWDYILSEQTGTIYSPSLYAEVIQVGP